MFTSFKELQKEINFTMKSEINLGLERMRRFLEKVGNPQNQIKIVHIGGTNGKGSTLRFLESILQEAGHHVGTFHSPSYEYINDQISVNGAYITDRELMKIIKIFNEKGLDEAGLTEFELQTAMAYYYFAFMKKVDFALIEVGLGGREDSTNVIKPVLSIITNVGYDHIGFLGTTIKEIAAHKAGIIKKGIPVICGEQKAEAKEVIKAEAKTIDSPISFMEEDFSYSLVDREQEGETFSFHSKEKLISDIRISMQGEHQVANASLAIKAYLTLTEKGLARYEENILKRGLLKATHPGRFEVVSRNPLIIMDGAHNDEAMDALVRSMEMCYSNRKVIVLFSALIDKPIESMVKKLEKLASEIIFTSFHFPRAARAENIYHISHHPNKQVEEEWEIALNAAVSRLDEESVLLVTGSLYFISETRSYLTRRKDKV
ncbi:bifunctional folylpolyglutamate synthase/dihydrofolate synthase [Sutcliffiella horikoshii]|uniref:bifunctional folylpolyglutamate synthase/dihydrofolate synthase n=1 Tax=Sutcliffiella horikoshii TaxID=79883 RepID=UPI001F27CAAD|nr:folylpolyglutamate synthase/dihydrofolate synthase family protein [Sutcliffiella horikoshii]MCG1022177.1 bifunctional folylpolyglutamate synthase/dihydrofolate synthase [Sutcliffiella horikoshii]